MRGREGEREGGKENISYQVVCGPFLIRTPLEDSVLISPNFKQGTVDPLFRNEDT